MSSKNWIPLDPQHEPALDLLQGGALQFPQTPAAFNTPFFWRITVEKLIQTLVYVVSKIIA